MKAKYSIYDHLDEVRKRPAMYVGEVRLDYIFVYLAGFRSAMILSGVNNHSVPDFHEFHEFVRERYQFSDSSMGWANMIVAVTLGFDPTDMNWEDFRNKNISQAQHQRSVAEFFNLVDEYRGTKTD